MEMIQQMQMGLNFMPDTNMNSQPAMQRTVSAYINNNNAKRRAGSAKPIQPDRNYIKTNSGKTGYVSYPNKS